MLGAGPPSGAGHTSLSPIQRVLPGWKVTALTCGLRYLPCMDMAITVLGLSQRENPNEPERRQGQKRKGRDQAAEDFIGPGSDLEGLVRVLRVICHL
jgi:hypothetical protein